MERDKGLEPFSIAWKARAQPIYQSRVSLTTHRSYINGSLFAKNRLQAAFVNDTNADHLIASVCWNFFEIAITTRSY